MDQHSNCPQVRMRASYTDQFDHALDDKGRLTIPSEWRGTDYEEQLFAFPSKDGCLKVYPASWLGALQEKIAHLPMVDPQRKQIEAVAEFVYRSTSGAR